jgi:hypothetical protein
MVDLVSWAVVIPQYSTEVPSICAVDITPPPPKTRHNIRV